MGVLCAHAQEEWRGEVIEVSWSPRAFLFKGFLSELETSHLIEKARARMRMLPLTRTS